jgi:hypothetical protein
MNCTYDITDDFIDSTMMSYAVLVTVYIVCCMLRAYPPLQSPCTSSLLLPSPKSSLCCNLAIPTVKYMLEHVSAMLPSPRYALSTARTFPKTQEGIQSIFLQLPSTELADLSPLAREPMPLRLPKLCPEVSASLFNLGL